ncbi:hypothetical protein A3A93_04505 [Candidatus Roizmanbacteria bacterium RIFCSPLOWO2_01_FULL_38_12]|uniref:Uncharacterized protein n=1 Tax=Candidatus Roizmanbacteria bacterium RIFCSPLOWO2_01_FULL_38_12 TaxID=1802061 RepID=A0A1F7IXE4_9BACT|nr:MAG: hypothetical protein A2861_01975 [Candidatus Roizmanbacteria bacterium RIFCSPHIGHO2_01_FULL_38_15]OGK35500.1 MAG: hypothetical protein A3F59_01005 [Candidatus Roizmanbacteria bacterium RIFCSPHIGHO2_12_FULL_38_13]OGK48030.1 MAG: hypothetical protein A3A93_04505 [Candidatus Roizmanbacteria bacterium RIFCSPLOWO2_01_FULL_38_12]
MTEVSEVLTNNSPELILSQEAQKFSGNFWQEIIHQHPRDITVHQTDLAHHDFLKETLKQNPSLFANSLNGKLHDLQRSLNLQNEGEVKPNPVTNLLAANGANRQDLVWFIEEVERVVRDGTGITRPPRGEVNSLFDVFLNGFYREFHKDDDDERWRFSDATRESMRNILYFVQEAAEHTMVQNEINKHNNYLQPLKQFAHFLRIQLKSVKPPITEEKRQELIRKGRFSPTRDMLPDHGVSSADIPWKPARIKGRNVTPVDKDDDATLY